MSLLDLDRGFFDLRNLTGDHLGLSLLCLLEFVFDLLQGEWILLSLHEALLDRWVGSEVLVEGKVKADWLWGCLVGLHSFFGFP